MTQTSSGNVVPIGEGQEAETSDMWVADGLRAPDLGATVDAPPAYGDHHDQLQLSQAGFEAGAAVTGEEKIESAPFPGTETDLEDIKATAGLISTSTRRIGDCPRSSARPYKNSSRQR